jgi:hypothetical protein
MVNALWVGRHFRDPKLQIAGLDKKAQFTEHCANRVTIDRLQKLPLWDYPLVQRWIVGLRTTRVQSARNLNRGAFTWGGATSRLKTRFWNRDAVPPIAMTTLTK